jgi:DNA-binding CsgD family transcriptional regulator
VVRELAEVEDVEQYPTRVTSLLRQLVPCDGSSYNMIDPASGRAELVTDPGDRVFDGGPEVLAELAWQHPLFDHYARTRDGRALRISDFLSRRELHLTDLYEHIYKHIGLEYQMAVTLSVPGEGVVVGLALDRSGRDFTDAERDLMELLRPHLASAFARLQDIALLRRAVDELDEPGGMLLLSTADGTVAWCTKGAAARLGVTAGWRLPEPLRRHLCSFVEGTRAARGGRGPGTSEIVQMPGFQLRVRIESRPFDRLYALHVTNLSDAVTPEQLRALGLNARQAEVMALLVQGMTAAQIGDAVHLSRRTVEKHLAASYARLGARTRAEAIMQLARSY